LADRSSVETQYSKNPRTAAMRRFIVAGAGHGHSRWDHVARAAVTRRTGLPVDVVEEVARLHLVDAQLLIRKEPREVREVEGIRTNRRGEKPRAPR